MQTKRKVLVVDDELLIVTVLTDLLFSLGYEVLSASSGEEGIEAALNSKPDVILLDVVMPGIDGYEVLRRLKANDATRHVPVIILTGLVDKDSKQKGLEAGAIDFINKPMDIAELSIRLRNVMEIKEYHDHLKNYNEELEKTVEQRTAELRQAYIDTINRLTIMADYRDSGTGVHLKRVSHFVNLLASVLGLSGSEIDVMYHAAPMHDIGKIGIMDSILQSREKLTLEQFEVIKTHTTIGASVLCGSDSELLKSAKRFALYHHETWDGRGYPYGLKGEEIAIEGRIMLIVDRYDALRSSRPYKPSLDHEETLKALIEGDGRSDPKHFDPRIYKAFKDNHHKFAEIYDEHKAI